MKKTCIPNYYKYKDKDGNDIKVKVVAEAQADYLATKQWGKSEAGDKETRKEKARSNTKRTYADNQKNEKTINVQAQTDYQQTF